MKGLGSRLGKLEHQFGVSEPLQVVIFCSAARRVHNDICVETLKEMGLLPRSGLAYINVLSVPDGLSKEETRRFVRINADIIRGCAPPDPDGTFHPVWDPAPKGADNV